MTTKTLEELEREYSIVHQSGYRRGVTHALILATIFWLAVRFWPSESIDPVALALEECRFALMQAQRTAAEKKADEELYRSLGIQMPR